MAEPTAEQIKSDLIGKKLEYYGVTVWSFDAPSEFLELTIKGRQVQGELIEYDVSIRLRDVVTGSQSQYLADALVVYRKADAKWQLVSVVAKLWRAL